MALVAKTLTLDITPGSIPQVVNVSEYDENREYTVTLIDDGGVFEIPSGTTATVDGSIGGNAFSESATVSGNTITFTLSESMTALAGDVWCKIKLTKDSKPIQTAAFILRCDRAGVEAGTVIGADGFQEQIDKAVEAYIQRVGVQKDDLICIRYNEAQIATTFGKNLDNLSRNTYLWTAKAYWDNAPAFADSFFWVFTLSSYNTNRDAPDQVGSQLIVSGYTGRIIARRITGGVWGDWATSTEHPYASNPKYIAYGDSITQGAIWDTDTTTPYYIAATQNQIPTRIANAIMTTDFANHGVSGARFVKQGESDTTTIIGDVIKADDLSDAEIITIGGGRNDSATALGDGATATADDGTICGAFVGIFEHLRANYPKLQIVVYGVTPQPTENNHAPENIFTRVFAGGWSLLTYYQEVGKVCARYGVPFIGWTECTLMYNWGVLSGGYSSGTRNWSHPADEETLAQMGNYLGGRVAAYYTG